ncbi:MAG TPA: hypothetical protein VGI66_13245, partial [Streptosporangiaceae bacterium]
HDLAQRNLPEPDRGLARTSRRHLAVTGPAVALVAAMAASLGAWSGLGAAQPAAIPRPASLVSPATSPAPGPGMTAAMPESRPVVLDALLVTTDGRTGARPAASGGSVTEGGTRIRLTPRQVARRLLHRFHWRQRQFRYLNLLWSRESSWNIHAFNAYSGAYGIPQAVPGSKMASAGPRWQSSARTQILWGLRYIKQRYGSPEGAWNHERSTGWY